MKHFFRIYPIGHRWAILLALTWAGVSSSVHADTTVAASDASVAARIIPVESWGGSRPQELPKLQVIRRITLHHQGETWKPDSDVAHYLQRLQQWSRLTKRWADIPYHYVVAPDGKMYAARDPGLAGDTNTEYNPEGHALVMLLGNFEEAQPSQAQLLATVDLLAWLVNQHHLNVDDIATHRDFSAQTLCPGKNLTAHIASGWLTRAVQSRLAGLPVAEP